MTGLVIAEPYTGTLTPLPGFVAMWTMEDWQGQIDIRWAPIVGVADGEFAISDGASIFLLRDHLEELHADPEVVDLVPIALLDEAAKGRLMGLLGFGRHLN